MFSHKYQRKNWILRMSLILFGERLYQLSQTTESKELRENKRPSLILDGSKMDISFLMTMMVNLVHLCLKRNKATWHGASPSTKQTQPLNKRHPNRIWKWQTIGRENQSNLDEGRIRVNPSEYLPGFEPILHNGILTESSNFLQRFNLSK